LSGPAAPPTFSVVIPTLGRARRLHGCLSALARLDYPSELLEVLVVNDGGGRDTEEAASDWTGRLQLTVIATSEAGAAAARNAGAERANGRFIAFTDDDCEPEGGWLRALQPVLEANPGAAVGGTTVNGATGRCAVGSQTVFDAAHAYFNRDPAAPTFFASNNLTFPADHFRAVGGFDKRFRFAEDRALCEQWLSSGRRFVHAPEAVVRHMRALTPRTFWWQHFCYGRGAWTLYRTRAERDGGRFAVDPTFYAELVRQVRRKRNWAGRPSVAALAAISQIAYAAGFGREALRRRGKMQVPLEGPGPHAHDQADPTSARRRGPALESRR
jgi:glycosyltransferase involved in cell wall biosynthesis